MKNKLYKFVNGKRVAALKKIECPVCKKVFQALTSKDKYCSRECYYEMKRIRKDRVKWTKKMRDKMSEKYKGKGNPMYGKVSRYKGKKRPEIWGENHWNWKGGYTINKDGYKIIENQKETNGFKITAQKKIVEEFIGRKLNKNEVVHHINGNKLDNRIENLQIMTRAEHMNIHRKEILEGRKLSDSSKKHF